MPSKKKSDMKIGVFDEVSSDIIKEVLETDFSKTVRAHDLKGHWKNYVPHILMEKWPNLSLETRIAVYHTALFTSCV